MDSFNWCVSRQVNAGKVRSTCACKYMERQGKPKQKLSAWKVLLQINDTAVWRTYSSSTTMRSPQSCNALITFLSMPFLSVLFLGSCFNTHLSITSASTGCWTQSLLKLQLLKNYLTTSQWRLFNTKVLIHLNAGRQKYLAMQKQVTGPAVVEVCDKKFGSGQINFLLPKNNKLHILFLTLSARTECLYLIFILGDLIYHNKCFCLYLSSCSCYLSCNGLANAKCNYTAFRKEQRPATQKGILPGASKFKSLQSSAAFCST